MSSEMASGVFALAGVLLAGLSAWVGAALQRRWTLLDAREARTADLDREREARLFEHKLAAYSAYLLEENAARKRWVDAAARGERPPLDATGPLYDRGISLQILGSARAATAEIQATKQTDALLQSSPGEERKRIAAGLGASLVELTNAIREDLDVEGEIFRPPTAAHGS